jgi:hypothetical protein
MTPDQTPGSTDPGPGKVRNPYFTRLFAIVAGMYTSINRIRALAQELIGLQPDIILAA